MAFVGAGTPAWSPGPALSPHLARARAVVMGGTQRYGSSTRRARPRNPFRSGMSRDNWPDYGHAMEEPPPAGWRLNVSKDTVCGHELVDISTRTSLLDSSLSSDINTVPRFSPFSLGRSTRRGSPATTFDSPLPSSIRARGSTPRPPPPSTPGGGVQRGGGVATSPEEDACKRLFYSPEKADREAPPAAPPPESAGLVAVLVEAAAAAGVECDAVLRQFLTGHASAACAVLFGLARAALQFDQQGSDETWSKLGSAVQRVLGEVNPLDSKDLTAPLAHVPPTMAPLTRPAPVPAPEPAVMPTHADPVGAGPGSAPPVASSKVNASTQAWEGEEEEETDLYGVSASELSAGQRSIGTQTKVTPSGTATATTSPRLGTATPRLFPDELPPPLAPALAALFSGIGTVPLEWGSPLSRRGAAERLPLWRLPQAPSEGRRYGSMPPRSVGPSGLFADLPALSPSGFSLMRARLFADLPPNTALLF
eukprot:Hpha_TRINITY_DN15280_c1_g3::TRINITY_DN15280_c1_g3_i1::g.67739::m.67739